MKRYSLLLANLNTFFGIIIATGIVEKNENINSYNLDVFIFKIFQRISKIK